MAKISTYPPVSSPSLSDLLIGTNVANDNATENFPISDILGLASGLYVPYTGATVNVDLGTFTLSSGGADFFGPVYLDDALLDGAGNPGTVGQILSSNATSTQWIDVSSLLSDLQGVLDLGNTADQNITLTGAANSFLMSGANGSIIQQGINSYIEQTGTDAYIKQSGVDSYIEQTGSSAFILQSGAGTAFTQTGLNAFISQSGNNSFFKQFGTTAYIEQSGLDAYITQTGNSAYISQTGSASKLSQQGVGSFIEQLGGNSYFKQFGTTAYIEQSGSTAIIRQTGNNANILQTGSTPVFSQQGTGGVIEQLGANAYFKQFNPSAYIEPSQIKDGSASFGTAGQVLSSLGPSLGLAWTSPLTAIQLGSFYDLTNQTTTIGIAVPMKIGTDDIVGYGVSVTADGLGNRTQIEVTQDGIYNIQFSAQLVNGGGGSSEVDIWFRKNGTNITNSNTQVSMQSNANAVASWNFFVSLVTTDKIQIMWTQNNNNTTIATAAAVAPHPATPSVILTVNRVR